MKKFWYFFILLLMIGCARYHPLPLTAEAEKKALKGPDLQTLVVKASRLKHPLLKPVPLNLQDGLSPDEAALLAVVANPELRAIRDEKKIAAAQVLEAGLLPNPRLGMEYESPTGGETRDTVKAYRLELSWEITGLLLRSARLSSARAQKAAVDLTVAWKEWQVAEAAKLHALRLLWLRRKYALLSRVAREREKRLLLIRKAVALGQKTTLDLSAARAACQEIKLKLASIREKEIRERSALMRLLGLPPGTPLRLEREKGLSSWPPPLKKKRLLSGLSRRRLDLVALKMTYRAQDARLRAEVLSQFPRIEVGILRARDIEDVLTAGFTLSVELPFLNRRKSRIALARATREKLYHEYLARLFSARGEVVEILERMDLLRQKIALSQRTVAGLREVLRTYRLALRQGNADLLSYYQLEDEFLKRRLELLDLYRLRHELGVALELASGVYIPVEGRDVR